MHLQSVSNTFEHRDQAKDTIIEFLNMPSSLPGECGHMCSPVRWRKFVQERYFVNTGVSLPIMSRGHNGQRCVRHRGTPKTWRSMYTTLALHTVQTLTRGRIYQHRETPIREFVAGRANRCENITMSGVQAVGVCISVRL